MSGKKGFQISFAWLFAIIAGVFILFLAIFLVTRLINLGQYEISTETEKKIGVLLNPLEIKFETGKTTLLNLGRETRIYGDCDDYSLFGRQIIRISQESFGRWPEPAQGVSFKNKYIFSEKIAEGKNFYIFTKPFEFPFKVTDLIYLTSASDEYCFIDAPTHIKNELEALNQGNILLDDCSDSDESIKVCFNGNDCDIEVDYSGNRVKKNQTEFYFTDDSLMYAAIFSDKDIYECQLKRIMQRTSQLSLLYRDKANLISKQGCSSNLNPKLSELSSIANNFETSESFKNDYMVNLVKEIQEENKDSMCRLW